MPWASRPRSDRDHFTVNIRGTLYRLCSLPRLARQPKQRPQRAARDARWLPVRELQSLAGRAQYMYSAIPAARFYLRELHDVVASKWGGRVRMTQLRRDLQWWTAMPTQSNGHPIHRHVETAYVHCDSSGYGWGAVLNGRLEARRARYIRSAANVWADRLSGHLDTDDLQLNPVMFAELEAMWGAHSVDRFASAMNAMLPHYNAAWLDPCCEAVDCLLHLSDAE
eukprot:jgi/Tetstr1/442464/TSEL_003210.t1